VNHKLLNCIGFQWDEANFEKNWISHQVSSTECEQIFFNQPLLLGDDEQHSKKEERYHVLGQTNEGRQIFLVCTVRNEFIRVISARDMNKLERKEYDE